MSDQTIDEIRILAREIIAKCDQHGAGAPTADKPAIAAVVPASPPILKLKDEVRLEAGQSLQAACEEAKKGGCVLTVPAGMTLPAQEIKNIGKKPFWLRSEQPGAASVSGLMAKKNWTHVKNGVWECTHSGNPWAGACLDDEDYLFHFPTSKSLLASSIEVIDRWSKRKDRPKKTAYGFSYDAKKRKLYVRLRDNADPNSKNIEFTNRMSKPVLSVTGSSGLIIDGLEVTGAGAAAAIDIAENSRGVEIRNCLFHHSKFGARLADDCTMAWNEYRYKFFRKWLKEMIALNGGSAHAAFQLIKLVYSSGANAAIEGRIAASHGGPSNNCTWHHNLSVEVFDAHRLGLFTNSHIHHDVAYGCGDDAIEAEGFNKTHTGKNNKVTDCLLLDCIGSYVSVQDKGNHLIGPGTFERLVCATTDPDFGNAYAIKDMGIKKAKTFTFRDCTFHMSHTNRSSWGDKHWPILADEKVIAGKISPWEANSRAGTARNITIGAKSTEVQGEGGRHAGKDPNEFFPGWGDINTAPDDLNFVPSKDIGAGAFAPGDQAAWRSLDREFSNDPPEKWK